MKAVKLYAQILVDVASSQSGTDVPALVRELGAFAQSVAQSPIAVKAFASPVISEEDKQKLIQELSLKAGVSVFGKRFLSLLARSNRLNLLSQILSEVEVIEVEKRGGVVGELVSAIVLDAATVDGLKSALTQKMNKPVTLNAKVDPSVIAGMKVTLGGVTYDGTVRGKLDKLAGIQS